MAQQNFTVTISKWADLLGAFVALVIVGIESVQQLLPPKYAAIAFAILAVLRAWHERVHVVPTIASANAAAVPTTVVDPITAVDSPAPSTSVEHPTGA